MSGADSGNACAGLPGEVLAELRAIAALHEGARGPLMRLVAQASGAAGSVIERLPESWRGTIETASAAALEQAWRLAAVSQPQADGAGWLHRARAWAAGEQWHRVTAAVSGALGGAGGIATTLVDLPVTTTLILRSIQEIAREHGEDPADPAVRSACIAVFGLGGPLRDDDDADTGLWAARLALGGKVGAQAVAAVLPRFGVMVSEKLLAQATPLIGAAIGAAINPLFTAYYQAMAHVHFRLRALERTHDPEALSACFERIVRSRAT
ncbi:EcsC family protein [Sphingomonas jatrophae]|uniref:EcsC protein family protein n=1 Tax=Sphingomonas jatrophae TaxID=1166337 RepID=A0A1I6MAC7_9SPHN|nr:EcsC family protein [Sphingomonas jatrophae]SFS12597.1 EcsC protein family protein [Sphingomonas jatrophae]